MRIAHFRATLKAKYSRRGPPVNSRVGAHSWAFRLRTCPAAAAKEIITTVAPLQQGAEKHTTKQSLN
jgi:hypothetical protein